MAAIVYFVQDLLFTSKIRETARHAGLDCEAVRDPSALAARAAGAKLVIVDLRLPAAMRALEAMAGDAAAKTVRRVGFVDHELLDVMDAARALGCEAMAKGAFSAKLPSLIATSDAPAPRAHEVCADENDRREG